MNKNKLDSHGYAGCCTKYGFEHSTKKKAHTNEESMTMRMRVMRSAVI